MGESLEIVVMEELRIQRNEAIDMLAKADVLLWNILNNFESGDDVDRLIKAYFKGDKYEQ